ncbi:MAG: YigZ family protein, partial [Bacteroidia bacterium]
INEEDTYLTISDTSQGTFRDRGSKFIGYAFHVKDEEDVKNRLEELRKEHASARHFCYAYLIRPENEYWRANDDGEPSGSAGKPILGQIRSRTLQETLVVVVRYFGGTLLGVPGLINAYKQAAAEALENCIPVSRVIASTLILETNYEKIGELMKFLKDNQLEYEPPKMTEKVQIATRIPRSKLPEYKQFFKEKTWLSNSDPDASA